MNEFEIGRKVRCHMRAVDKMPLCLSSVDVEQHVELCYVVASSHEDQGHAQNWKPGGGASARLTDARANVHWRGCANEWIWDGRLLAPATRLINDRLKKSPLLAKNARNGAPGEKASLIL
jgi:hypothetical protein